MSELLVTTPEKLQGLTEYSEWVRASDVRAAMTEVDADRFLHLVLDWQWLQVRYDRDETGRYEEPAPWSDYLLAHMEGK